MKSVSLTSDDTYSVGVMGPLNSMPSLNGSVVYTRMSGRASIFCWSSEPATTAFPWQQTLPPYDITGCSGSYANVSGLSALAAFIDSVPSPLSVLALPLLPRWNVMGTASFGGHTSDVFHWFSPIT